MHLAVVGVFHPTFSQDGDPRLDRVVAPRLLDHLLLSHGPVAVDTFSVSGKAPNGPNGWFRGLNRFKPDLS